MKIVLISPKGPLYRYRGGIYRRSLRYAPLTMVTLASLIPADMDVELELIDEGIEEIDLDLKADLVGITLITGTAVRAYQLADHFREKGKKVVLGGSHVTLIPEEAQSHADSIVVGYAEHSWPKLLDDFAKGELKPRYDQEADFDLKDLPLPRRELFNHKHYLTTHVFEATRGCIHNCDFCIVPVVSGREPYQKPVEEIIEDIRRYWAKKIIFLDLNLIADKEYAARLFEALIPLKLNWFGLTTTLLVDDPPLLELAARSGCSGLLMGFESLSHQNLQLSEKQFNSPQDYMDIVDVLHNKKISLMACFTFGMDYDNPEIFRKTAQLCIDAKIDLPRFAIVTPFPGTELYNRLEKEKRIITKNWELYDGQHVVFQPKNLTVKQLYDGHEFAWKYTYSCKSIFSRIAGSRVQIPVSVIANIGYRFYAYHLDKFYNCDWIIGQRSGKI